MHYVNVIETSKQWAEVDWLAHGAGKETHYGFRLHALVWCKPKNRHIEGRGLRTVVCVCCLLLFTAFADLHT